jgi:hypothetical protein
MIRPYSHVQWLEKELPSVAEQKEKESRIRQEQQEKTKSHYEAYKQEHGHYPIPKIVFSPNHPEAQ